MHPLHQLASATLLLVQILWLSVGGLVGGSLSRLARWGRNWATQRRLRRATFAFPVADEAGVRIASPRPR